MTEKALLFGEDKSVVGIVSDPPPGVDGSGWGVIILNAGVLHRVGPNRVHVQIARALASAGLVSLRFDFSGIGDSRQSGGTESFVHKAVREVGLAMDVLQTSRGISRFVIVGICSGADHGLPASCQDPRIQGAVLIDGYNLPSLGLLLYFYRWKLINPRSWIRFLAGRSQTWSLFRSLVKDGHSTRAVLAQAESTLPSRVEFVEQMRGLAERGTELLLVYTWQSPAYYNYQRLLRRSLGTGSVRQRVRVEYLDESDHVFTLRCNQERLVELVRGWALGLPRAKIPVHA